MKSVRIILTEKSYFYLTNSFIMTDILIPSSLADIFIELKKRTMKDENIKNYTQQQLRLMACRRTIFKFRSPQQHRNGSTGDVPVNRH
jgi:hypothetical protein